VKALEATATIDQHGQIKLDKPLQMRNQQVKVIILVPEEEDLEDTFWLEGVAASESFDFLAEPEEDIYTIQDGKPLTNEA